MVRGELADEDICLFCRGNRDFVKNNFLSGVLEVYITGANGAS